jgi:heavy metal translocating P-type ATPase
MQGVSMDGANRWPLWIAALTIMLLLIHAALRGWFPISAINPVWFDRPSIPLWIAIVVGGVPLVVQLAMRLASGQWGSDLLAGISILTAAWLNQPLAGALVVLMLSGGEALEQYAIGRASSALDALARRMPTIAHRRKGETIDDVPLAEVVVGDVLVLHAHETCPVDGEVIEGRGGMDESFVSGEPYRIAKSPGSQVISGAVNQESVLVIRAIRVAHDSRYAQIMRVMEASSKRKPAMHRLADRLGAIYTPLALALAIAAWVVSGEAIRFLAVLVVATPCPLLIAIPVAIVGAISRAARRGIIIRDPAILERLPLCKRMVFDKTGTLTYGRPTLTGCVLLGTQNEANLLRWTAAIERYSKHPLAAAIGQGAAERGVQRLPLADRVEEQPGKGLRGVVEGVTIAVTSRKGAIENARWSEGMSEENLPPRGAGMECVVVIDGCISGLLQFRDAPRPEGRPFIDHLSKQHGVKRVLLASGDRAEEVQSLAARVGIEEVHAGLQPEQKVTLVESLLQQGDVLFVGDGINDAPAMARATVSIALGRQTDVVGEAASAVVLDPDLSRIDELIHLSVRMRRIALQSAVGGMLASLVGMLVAAFGYLPPAAGALLQEAIDVLAVLHALRTAVPAASPRDRFIVAGRDEGE